MSDCIFSGLVLRSWSVMQEQALELHPLRHSCLLDIGFIFPSGRNEFNTEVSLFYHVVNIETLES